MFQTEISKKVKNNPNSFANTTEIKSELYSIKVNEDFSRNTFTEPKMFKTYDDKGKTGVPLFYDETEKRLFVDHTDKHSLVVGSTGSKKSRLLAMPSVYSIGCGKESMIISDPKAEIFLKTSDYLKKQGYQVLAINLREPIHGVGWNPLAVPYKWYLAGNIDKAYEFVNDIAINLTQGKKSNSDPFWENSAGSFFFGLVLLLFKYCKEQGLPSEYVNIGNIMQLRNAMCSVNPATIKHTIWWRYAKTDSFITSTLIGTIETANDTRAGILSTFDQNMRTLAIQPSLLNMLSHNDVDYDSITEKPTAIFLIVPDEKTGYHSLVSLFVKQSYEYLVYRAQQKIVQGERLNYRVNYILDEFSSLPTINDFPAMITAARSRNIRFNLFLQSKHQLNLRYNEEANTIMANCENWIFLTSREIDFLREISELCGEITNSQGKLLLTTSELQRLDKSSGEALVLHGRAKPFISRLADIDEICSIGSSFSFEEHVHPEWLLIDFNSKEHIEFVQKMIPEEGQISFDSDIRVQSLFEKLENMKPFAEKND